MPTHAPEREALQVAHVEDLKGVEEAVPLMLAQPVFVLIEPMDRSCDKSLILHSGWIICMYTEEK